MSTTEPATEPAPLPLRSCVVCNQTDDHPRCLVVDGTGAALDYHKDCHRNAFGDTYVDADGVTKPYLCHAVLGAGGAGLKGDALRSHIVSGG